MKSGKMSLVIRLAAVGIITLQWMLFLAPSMARVLDRPIRPILAALETKQILLNLARELERSQILTNFPEILSNFNKFSQKT